MKAGRTVDKEKNPTPEHDLVPSKSSVLDGRANSMPKNGKSPRQCICSFQIEKGPTNAPKKSTLKRIYFITSEILSEITLTDSFFISTHIPILFEVK